MLVLALAAWLLGPAAALALCLPVAEAPARVQAAAFAQAALPAAGELRLTYLGHSSFLIETAGGVSVVTDYNGVHRAPFAPDVVTMNNAHSTHYTDVIEPGVRHVLRGWSDGQTVLLHDLLLEDLHIRNVPTNVRAAAWEARVNGNSIFVFEAAELCVAHLGHLHHILEDVHLAELGVIDVLLVPVDGSYTMAQELMVEVIRQVAPAVILPMHYFTEATLSRFLGLVAGRYEPIRRADPTVTLTRASLPWGKVIVLPPAS
jgi:L-ascorbate metabolism protein UlaG (beta-lactamase superfamily)